VCGGGGQGFGDNLVSSGANLWPVISIVLPSFSRLEWCGTDGFGHLAALEKHSRTERISFLEGFSDIASEDSLDLGALASFATWASSALSELECRKWHGSQWETWLVLTPHGITRAMLKC